MKRSTAFKIGLALLIIPFVIGLIVYDNMPDQMPIHFDINNQADNFASKNFALFGIPASMLILYVLAYSITNMDPKKSYQSDKTFNIVLFLAPILSITTSILSISYAKGDRPNIGNWTNILLSIAFIFIGNYLPKTKRNYTLGIKLPWTMDNDYVWDKTHRFGGKVYIICGFIGILISLLFKNNWILFAINLVVMVVLPMIYSYKVYMGLSSEE